MVVMRTIVHRSERATVQSAKCNKNQVTLYQEQGKRLTNNNNKHDLDTPSSETPEGDAFAIVVVLYL